jgi:hypothetical protein
MRWVVIVAMVLALALAFAVPETKQVTPPSPAA